MTNAPLTAIHSSTHTNSSIAIKNLCISHKANRIIDCLSLAIPTNKITCIIGPSGSGKSTLLRSFNRMDANLESWRVAGDLLVNGKNILSKNCDLIQLRKQVGMLFQQACVFPTSIYENVLFGLRAHQRITKDEGDSLVKELLISVGLWSEVSDRLEQRAETLSIGQQQRLCLARTLALQPSILLLDEPTSSLDPQSTRSIENLCLEQNGKITQVFVTHNLGQAKRIADYMVFLCEGKLIEAGPARNFFSHPTKQETKAYLSDESRAC